jgi:hypothetical protein
MARPKCPITQHQIRLANNLCPWCGKPKDTNGYHCSACRKKMCESQALLKKERQANGLCPECGAPAETQSAYALCMTCWFKHTAKHHTGSKLHWHILKRVWEKQQGKCRYTGVMLIPGKTASIDHIIPRDRGGTHDESNLQWVTNQINRMKTNFTHGEFIAMCRHIANTSF